MTRSSHRIPSLLLALAVAGAPAAAAPDEAGPGRDAERPDRLSLDLSLERFDRMPNGSIRYFNEALGHDRRGVSIRTLSVVRRQDGRKLGFAVDGRLGTRPGGAELAEIHLLVVDDGRELERAEIRSLELRADEPTSFGAELWLRGREFDEAYEDGRAPVLRLVLIVRERG